MTKRIKPVTVGDLPAWEQSEERMARSGSRYYIEPRHPSLFCEVCGETYSANPGDYFALPKDHIFECHGEPMRLVMVRTVMEDV